MLKIQRWWYSISLWGVSGTLIWGWFLFWRAAILSRFIHMKPVNWSPCPFYWNSYWWFHQIICVFHGTFSIPPLPFAHQCPPVLLSPEIIQVVQRPCDGLCSFCYTTVCTHGSLEMTLFSQALPNSIHHHNFIGLVPRQACFLSSSSTIVIHKLTSRTACLYFFLSWRAWVSNTVFIT